MNEETRLRIRRELAERMGYFVEIRWRHVANDNWAMYDLRLPGGIYAGSHSASEDEAWTLAPDPFASHKACAALVEWLAGQKIAVLECFGRELSRSLGLEREIDCSDLQHYHLLQILASPLEARVLAACAALGIDTGDE